jgi:adenylate cyclase
MAGMDDRAEALYRVVRLGSPGYQRADVARLAGIERSRSVQWWRAMGFPEIPEDVPAFTEVDVEMVRRLASLTGAGLIDDPTVLRLARLLGASFSRIAEAQVAAVEGLLDALPASTTPGPESAATVDLVTGLDSVFELLERSLVYVWRRQLLAALGRRLGADDTAAEQAVGFADLSGFTRL